MINLLVILFTLAGIRSILLRKNGLENSLNWIIFGFILGYRTFELFPGLKPGGKLILIECSKTGLLQLNKIRKMIGRKAIDDAEPWHNKFFDDNWLFEFVFNKKDILKLEMKHFASTYTFLTRILPFWRIFYYFRHFKYVPNIGKLGYFKAYTICKAVK